MKKMMTLVMMMVMTISAAAMSYNTARNEALFLSDKMAYELGLTNAQYEAVYDYRYLRGRKIHHERQAGGNARSGAVRVRRFG